MADPLAKPMLVVRGVATFYGAIQALHGVDLDVAKGEIVTLIGANGAGKSTLLMTICGNPRARAGAITLDGEDITTLATHEIVRRGVAQVPEGRRIFPRMSVFENLQMGATLADPAHFQHDLERVFAMFPRLAERRDQRGGTLSGGEQQMLAIGRALMSQPKVVLLDEPSLGLAPMLVEEIFGIVSRLVKQEKLSVLLVEQNATMALAVADHGYVMENGRIVLEGPAAKLRDNSDIKEFYLGLNEAGARKSYRDTKHYRRRKRWLQ
jgi:branched-chain amino acid transport system ATP-binding protein